MATISVNLDNAKIADLRLFERFQNGDYAVDDLLEFLGRIVESDKALEDLPLPMLSEIMAQVSSAADVMNGTDQKN